MTALLAQSAVAPVPSVRQRTVSRTELTPLSFLRRSAAVFPDKIAVVHGNRGTSYDYRTFAERVDRLASALQAAGLRQHDRVAFLCPNIPADGRSALRACLPQAASSSRSTRGSTRRRSATSCATPAPASSSSTQPFRR